jgi:microcystin degradation protein MlrC
VRIALAGFGAESSMFSPHRMVEDNFSIHRGADLLALYDVAAWVPDGGDIQWLPVMRAHGGSGGVIVPEVFESFVAEIADGMRALVAEGPLDGIFLDIHGASHVDGRDHAEEEVLHAIREVVGDGPVISLAMDTHGNFSAELADLVDLAVCFRHAPHIDAWEIRERAVRLLVEVVRRGYRPKKAHVRVPVLLPGERTSTLVEPAKTAFGALLPAIERHGVLDASLWVGFAWADEDRNGGAVFVTGDDEAAVVACAEEIARGYWEPREDFALVADNTGSLDEALDFLLTAPPAPLFISDSGDNVTAGGAGDVTFALTRTFERWDALPSPPTILFAAITDRDAVTAAAVAGVGTDADLAIGADLDDRFGGPVRRTWRVERLIDGRNPGEGIVGAILSSGAVSVVVKNTRHSFVDPARVQAMTGRVMPEHVWFPIVGYDAVVVKNGYLFPGQIEEAGSWFMALTPGGTDLDFSRLPFERVQRPIFPLDRDFEADLTPVLLPVRGAVA